MRRLRNKVIALVLAVMLIGILGTGWIAVRAFLADKHDYVMELISTAAPNAAALIGKQLDSFEDQFALVDEILRGSQSSGEVGPILQSAFKKLKGAERLDVYDRQGLVASLKNSEDAPSAKPLESLVGPRKLSWLAGSDGKADSVLFSSRVKDHLFLAVFPRAFFSDALDSARSLSLSLVADDGQVLAGSTSHGPDLKSALIRVEGQAVVARDIMLASGASMLMAVAPIPGTQGASLVSIVPADRVSQMVVQVLKSAAPFFVFIVILSILLAVTFSATLARPIEALTEATARISQGDWDIRMKNRSQDEIGKLVGAFSQMGAELSLRETALKKAHEDLLRSERLATLGQFGAGLAHEVKNPLNSILGFAQLLDKRLGATDETVKKYLGFILDETRRASRIISDLLGFSRQKPPTLGPVDLGELVKRSVELFQPQAVAAHASIELKVPTSPLPARLDRDQIHQVLLNLMTNAVHAMTENPTDRPKTLTLEVIQKAEGYWVYVGDSGSGIAPENLKRLFEPFFTTKGIGKGTGLGLALCHGIVQQHAGRIEIESSVGTGTTFKIWLPTRPLAAT